MKKTWMAVALLAAWAFVPRVWGQGELDLWYVIDMQGQRAGWSSTEVTKADGQITTDTDMRLTVKRGTLEIEIAIDSLWVETEGGEPVKLVWSQSLGGQPMTQTYTFEDDEIKVTAETPGLPPQERTVPAPEEEWLPPAAAQRYLAKRLEAGAKEITTKTLDVSQGMRVIESTRRVLEETTVDAVGRKVPAIKTSVVTSMMPGMESIEFIDRAGTTIRNEANIGGISMTTLLADRELALAELDPPEIMQSTFVEPSRAIDNPRASTRAVYVVSVPDGELPEFPTGGVQRVERIDGRSARVTVDPGAGATPAGEVDRERYLAKSGMLNTDDPAVRGLLAEAKLQGRTPVERAEELRGFVYDHIGEKTLGVGFASASEIARTGQGDCTEHATLLAALLRAEGIPARVVSGLIYADSFAGARDIFGYHMWAQALLEIDGEPRWVDLDATLPPRMPFDATHIAVAASALSDDEPDNAMVVLAPLLGRLAIEVEEVEQGAARRREVLSPAG